MTEHDKISEINEWDNPELREVVDSDNELKTWLVNYVGEKHNPEDGNVTVEMIVETLAQDFPEFTITSKQYAKSTSSGRGSLTKTITSPYKVCSLCALSAFVALSVI